MENFLSLENIPYDDKIWLVCKTVDIKTLNQWSVECAEFVVDNYNREYPDDSRISDCIEKTKLFLEGKISKSELSTARSTAWSAASTARSTAWSAASTARSTEKDQEDINLSILIALVENIGE
jgi:hypothetical protein